MAYRDDPPAYRHGDRRTHREHEQRQWDPRDARDAHDGGQHRDRDDDFARHDPAQRSYGRAGAPDVHGAPSGGYRRDTDADPGYNTPGYMRPAGHAWRGWDAREDAGPSPLHRDSWRGQPGWQGGRAQQPQRYQEDRSQERYQGGSGGPYSNRNTYAGTQTYGGHGDQLGYGSLDEDGGQHTHHDPDYLRWREQQLRALDADYQSWRGERYKKFSEEFDSWRKNRAGAATGGGAAADGTAAAATKPAKPAGGSGAA
ncbi:MAG TPA: hypothetical protein VMS38_32220 [Pseudorhodoferax sp.]|nr:hypothetical protein [Pseudorhodoferax sp.]